MVNYNRVNSLVKATKPLHSQCLATVTEVITLKELLSFIHVHWAVL